MTRATFLGAAGLLSLAACTTPGIQYDTKLMANSPAAASLRDVAVERFHGPAGGWYARRFEAMLADARLDGMPWFRLADYGAAPQGPVGVYTGDIDVLSHDFHEYTRTVSKCTEWDAPFDCETREDVEEFCVEETLRVQVTPRLFDSDTGEIVYSASYRGEASEKACAETGYPERGVFYDLPVSGFFGPDLGNGSLLREALLETLPPVRVDVAPRNATVKATFAEDALDPVVRADPRFEQAVEAGLKNPLYSCLTWEDLYAQYPTAPAVIHNHAACVEASGDFQTAQGLYGKAAGHLVDYAVDGDAASVFTSSLQRVSGQRYDLELIDRFSAPPQAYDGMQTDQDSDASTPIG